VSLHGVEITEGKGRPGDPITSAEALARSTIQTGDSDPAEQLTFGAEPITSLSPSVDRS
jgi:hypothetical protein